MLAIFGWGMWGLSGVSSINSFSRPCCYGCLLISKLLSSDLDDWEDLALTPPLCSIVHSISVKVAINDCKQAGLLLMSSRDLRASAEAELTRR